MQGQLKLADFGLARTFGHPIQPMTPKVRSGSLFPPCLGLYRVTIEANSSRASAESKKTIAQKTEYLVWTARRPFRTQIDVSSFCLGWGMAVVRGTYL